VRSGEKPADSRHSIPKGPFSQSSLRTKITKYGDVSRISLQKAGTFSAAQTVWRRVEDDLRTLIVSGFDPEISKLWKQQASVDLSVCSEGSEIPSILCVQEDRASCSSVIPRPLAASTDRTATGQPPNYEQTEVYARISGSGKDIRTGTMALILSPENARTLTKESSMTRKRTNSNEGIIHETRTSSSPTGTSPDAGRR